MSSPVIYPLVSVIVPAYNVETHIACSLESIIAQDYPNLEIIVVNDASTDATEAVARRILDGCDRPFTVITHKENRGVSAARNTGMDAAKGEFVWFIDADDMAEHNLVSTLYALVVEYKCDLSFCGFVDRFEDGRPDALVPVNLDGAKIRKGEELLWLRVFKKIVPHLCSMLFWKQFLIETGLRFQEGCTAGEDVEFQLKAFCRAVEVAFTSDCLYIYVHHAAMGSIRDNNSKEKHNRRYRDNTGVQFRTARYLSEHAPSERIQDVADRLLMPQALIRRLTLCAMTGDRAEFDGILSDNATRETLSAARTFFFRKPEVWLKSLALLHFPDIYYFLRSR